MVGQFVWLEVGAMLSHGSLKDTWSKESLFWVHLESPGCPDGAGDALQKLGSGQGRMREVCKSKLRKGVLPCCRNVLGLEMKSHGLDYFTVEKGR